MTDLVWLEYDQAALDAQYDQATLVPDPGAYVKVWQEWSAALRETTPPRVVRYGPGAEETMDLFGSGAVAHLHLHGGAWRALGKSDASFVAAGLGKPDVTVAVCDFGLAPDTGLPRIVAQVRAAAQALLSDHAQIVISGHSSGAHLAGTLLDRDWLDSAGIDAGRIIGALLVSGPYDLVPVQLSARNRYLNLTDDDVRALSVGRNLLDRLPPIHVMWGADELTEFQRQGAALADLLEAAGASVSRTVMPHNHFEAYDLFHDPGSPVCRAALAFGAKQTAQI